MDKIDNPAELNLPKGKLTDTFPGVTYEDWKRLVETELKGAPFDKKMLTETHEGITLRPIYRREDIAGLPHVNTLPGFAPFVRGSTASGYLHKPWEVSQELAFASPTEFNHAARNSISRGLNALNMVLDQATRSGNDPDWASPGEVGSGGLSIATVGDLERALEGIDLEQTSLFVRSGASALPFATLLVALVRRRKKTPVHLRGCIEMDPLGVLAHEGKLPQSLGGAYREMAALTRWTTEHAPQLQTICVHSRAWHEAGGNAVQELAFTLATAVEYLRVMSGLGLGAEVVAPRTRFAVTVGVNFFMEIAKLRALRMLWARVVSAAGGGEASQKLSLHIRTSQWNKTAYDPHNNLLRSTLEALAGALGGCDSMQVGAFDECFRSPDDFSRRVARNTQIVLQKECHLDHVIDPAGGSWYVESLTAGLAARSWALFQEVEKLGGMEAALRAEFPQKAVAATAAAKTQAVARRRETLVGLNQYANPKEQPLEARVADVRAFHLRRTQQVASHRTSLEDDESELVLEKLANIVDLETQDLFGACAAAATSGATIGEITRALRITDSPCPPVIPVRITRAAAAIESLRATMDQAARAGEKPGVFLCNMGGLRDYKARSDFTRGFLAVGGYETISPTGFLTPEAAVQAFAESKARIAVICSTDENYPSLVPPLAAAIRQARPDAVILLAGYPTEQIEAHKRAGVDEFIHLRADVVELLGRLHSRMGLTK